MEAPAAAARPLLDPDGARVILGSPVHAPVAPIAPSAHSLFAPRGACLASSSGPLYVCDTGHHRLLVWGVAPTVDGAAADLLIGQPEFCTEGRNGKGAVDASTLNVPTGVAASGGVLAVADAWNHRVLLWRELPARSNQPADVVLGQADFTSALANRGLGAQRPDTLYWPYGVALHAGRIFVADTGNRRVMIWNSLPERNGVPADVVLEEAMRWPHGIAVAADRLFVADAGLGRIIVFNRGFDSVRGEETNMPYGVTLQADRLVVADTANSRLLGYDFDAGPARWIAGRENLSVAARDSLCWPYGISACGDTLVIADSGNNRVLLWDRA
jgi:hypothetical protein